jgi:hypothetical protein
LISFSKDLLWEEGKESGFRKLAKDLIKVLDVIVVRSKEMWDAPAAPGKATTK